jgi:hypothetical protein
MKYNRLQRTFTAALLTLVATVAYSQTDALTATIPFAFRAVGSDLPAGRYTVSAMRIATGGSHTMQLRNLDTGKAVFLPSKTPAKASQDVRARLVFKCVDEEGCSLTSVWSGAGAGLEFFTPPLTASQRERRETIYLDRFKDK